MAEIVERKFKGDKVALQHPARSKKRRWYVTVSSSMPHGPFGMQASSYDVDPPYVLLWRDCSSSRFRTISWRLNGVDDLRLRYFYDFFPLRMKFISITRR